MSYTDNDYINLEYYGGFQNMPNIIITDADKSRVDNIYINSSFSGKVLAYDGPVLSRTVTHCTVAVTKSGVVVNDGPISVGDVLTITATADSGYTMSTLTVNGESHTSGQAITVSGDVVIVAVATETPEPSGYTWDGQFNGTELDSGDWVIHPIGTVGEYLTKEEVVGATLKYKVNNVESTLVVANANISDNDVGYSVYTESTGGLFMSVPETWQYDELEIPRGLYFQYIGNRAPGWESYEGDEVYGCSLELAQ